MVDEDEELHHYLKEIQQINLILKKIVLSDKENSTNDQRKQSTPKSGKLKELENLTSELNEKSQEIKNSNITPELTTKIHHELKTPLTPIKSYTDMLLKEHYGKLNDEQLQKINKIRNNIGHLEDAIQNLFTKNNLQNINRNQNADVHKIKELKQKNIILKRLEEKESEKLESSTLKITNLKNKLRGMSHKVHEQEQEEQMLEESIQAEKQKNINLSKRHYLAVILSVVVIAGAISSYSIYTANQPAEQYRIANPEPIKSSYIIQNLRGDTIDTWLSWRLIDGSVLHFNILNAGKYPEKIELVQEVILSEDIIELDDSLLHKGPNTSTSTLYLGWAGALQEAAQESTQFYIPNKLQVIESSTGEGQITITLTDMQNGDGYSGFTKTIADQSQNQILKSDITIYNVGQLSNEQFKTILRHELGHAFGLAHSTAPEDLMHPIIQTEFPYISECDVDALISLYNGSKKSEVVCEK